MNRKASAPMIGFAVIIASAFLAGAASARVLVTHATGPSSVNYPAGSVLKEPLDIELRSGDRITILDAVGTRVLVGPTQIKKGEIRRSSESQTAALHKLFENSLRARAGGTRNLFEKNATPVSAPATSASLWTLTESTQGDWCVDDPDAIEILRERATAKGKLIMTEASGASYDVMWPKGETLTYWPAGAKIAEGSTYQLQFENGQSQFVTLHIIKAGDRDLLNLGKELLSFSCHAQIDILFGDQ